MKPDNIVAALATGATLDAKRKAIRLAIASEIVGHIEAAAITTNNHNTHIVLVARHALQLADALITANEELPL